VAVEPGEDVIGGLGPSKRLAGWFQAAQKRLIAVMSSLTLAKSPRRSACRSTIEKKTSTRFSHDAEVGVKCSRMRGCLAGQPRTTGCLWVA
jgi:hypothetical protein